MSFLAKSLFISSLITASFGSVIVGALSYLGGFPSVLAWLNPHQGFALFLSGIGLASYMAYLFLAMRYSKVLGQSQAWWVIFGGLAAIALLLPINNLTSSLLAIWALLVGIIGPLAYFYWYSLFDQNTRTITNNILLPSMTLQLVNNQTLATDNLTGLNLWVFFRGNWCPVCMVQLNELAKSYQAIADKGVQTFMVSPQAESHSAKLANKIKAPMQFVVDSHSQLATAIGINVSNGLPTGLQLLGYDSDVPMPTVLLTDGKKVVWSEQTDNYRVRPEPELFLAAIDAYQAQKSAS